MKRQMQLGMIGQGRMGSSMVRRVLKNGRHGVVHDVQASATAALVRGDATAAALLQKMASRPAQPRAIWLLHCGPQGAGPFFKMGHNGIEYGVMAAYAGGRVSDSGQGHWTILAAIDQGVPVPVLSAAVFERFTSRGNADFANRALPAMRHAFGGHVKKPAS